MDLGLTFSGIWLSTVPTHQCEDISYVVTSPAAGFGPIPRLTSDTMSVQLILLERRITKWCT